jgi:hypothetical protein
MYRFATLAWHMKKKKKKRRNKIKNQNTKKNRREVGGHTKEVVSTTPAGVVGGSLSGRCSLT